MANAQGGRVDVPSVYPKLEIQQMLPKCDLAGGQSLRHCSLKRGHAVLKPKTPLPYLVRGVDLTETWLG